MSDLKLTYFDVRARVEVSRIMLTYAGRKFIDNRITHEDWPPIKSTTPLGSLPVLEIDGGKTRLCQSMAIARYIARETNFAGKDSLQQAQVDMIFTTIDELLTMIGAWFDEKDETKKAELEKHRNEVYLPNMFQFLENWLEKNANGGGFFVGTSVTLADFMAWHVFEYLISEDNNPLDKYPKLKTNRQVVTKLPKFAEYHKNRPVTPY